MIERILTFSVQRRFLVVLLVAAAAAFGVQSLLRLPIDAVPDITNNQIQITTLAPALSPFEIEQQVTFPVETALAGIAGLESTRSIRSEEHTSELQSLMRISYAVFCLKKKNIQITNKKYTEYTKQH